MDQPEVAVVTPPLTPAPPPTPFQIYATYVWTEKMGARVNFGSLVLNTPFEDIQSKEQIEVVVSFIHQTTGKSNVTLLSWTALNN